MRARADEIRRELPEFNIDHITGGDRRLRQETRVHGAAAGVVTESRRSLRLSGLARAALTRDDLGKGGPVRRTGRSRWICRRTRAPWWASGPRSSASRR